MTLKSVVLHFGAHKTGTSLVQKYMRDRKTLCDAQNVVAMPRGDADLLVGWGTSRVLDSGGPELLKRIEECSALGAEHFVLSHENSVGQPFGENGAHFYPDVKKRAAIFARRWAISPIALFTTFVRRPRS